VAKILLLSFNIVYMNAAKFSV